MSDIADAELDAAAAAYQAVSGGFNRAGLRAALVAFERSCRARVLREVAEYTWNEAARLGGGNA